MLQEQTLYCPKHPEVIINDYDEVPTLHAGDISVRRSPIVPRQFCAVGSFKAMRCEMAALSRRA